MNVSKAASTPVTIEIKVSGTETVKVWAFPSKVTQQYLDARRGDNYPISRILTEVIDAWDLMHDVPTEDIEDVEDPGNKKSKTKYKEEKLPITEDAINKELPLWLQSAIWEAIFQYQVPNLKKSNP